MGRQRDDEGLQDWEKDRQEGHDEREEVKQEEHDERKQVRQEEREARKGKREDQSRTQRTLAREKIGNFPLPHVHLGVALRGAGLLLLLGPYSPECVE